VHATVVNLMIVCLQQGTMHPPPSPPHTHPPTYTLFCPCASLHPPPLCPPPPLQVQYSLLSAGPAQSSVKAAADDLGITLIAYSPLTLGLLTGERGEKGGATG